MPIYDRLHSNLHLGTIFGTLVIVIVGGGGDSCIVIILQCMPVVVA